MVALYAGALLERAPGPKYVRELAFAEIALRPPLPRPATVAKWRAGLPAGFVTAMVAPREALVSSRGALRFEGSMADHLAATVAAADALEARFLVLPTTSEMTPGQRDRDLFAALLDKIGSKAGRTIVWAPAGLWEPEEAMRLAEKLGIVAAFDPLATSGIARPGPIAYARIQALGMRARLSEGLLIRALEAVLGSGATEAFVALDAPDSFKKAIRLQTIARGAATEAATDDEEDGDDDDLDDDDLDGASSDDDDAEDTEDEDTLDDDEE